AAALAASVVFLFWRGTPGRLNGRDGIPGFLLMLLMIAAWFSALYLSGNEDYLRAMLGGVLLPRIVGPEALAAEWYSSLAVLPALIMPWTLLPLFADWPAAFRGIPSAWRNRRSDGGASWLWIWLTCAAAILSCLPSIRLPMLLPAAAPLAVLAGRSVMRLSYARSRCFFGAAAALYALAGLALVLAETYLPLRAVIPADIMALIPDGTLPELPAEAAALLPMLSGIMYSGALLILLAVALLFFCRTPLPGGALLLTAFILSAAAAPWPYLTVPAISAASPAAAPEAAPSSSLLPAPGTADGPAPSAIPGTPADDPARPESDESPRPDASAAPEAPAATL
ncbi:MAG: hypothetical protein MJ061_05325, partial [Mailhella sp.]|nr:hypothetical protein [Mailhella sp.]